MAQNTLTIGLYGGDAKALQDDISALITIFDGNQRMLVRDYYRVGHTEFKLPFYDGLGDRFRVIAYVSGFKQTGFTPVNLKPDKPGHLDLMLIPEDYQFNFAGLDLERIKAVVPFMFAPDESDEDARDRYFELMEKAPKKLACTLNLAEAMKHIDLGGATPIDFMRQMRWNTSSPEQDRFFAYCDETLLEAVRKAGERGVFEQEHGCGTFHPGAFESWKQTQFQCANVQLTFHQETSPGKKWITVEPDIDYYRDPGAHALLEVCRNTVTGSLTEPAEVYMLRWNEHRAKGLPDFSPLYTVRPANPGPTSDFSPVNERELHAD
jgi:hypothetical protein